MDLHRAATGSRRARRRRRRAARARVGARDARARRRGDAARAREAVLARRARRGGLRSPRSRGCGRAAIEVRAGDEVDAAHPRPERARRGVALRDRGRRRVRARRGRASASLQHRAPRRGSGSERAGRASVDDGLRSSVPNVFAAGDVRRARRPTAPALGARAQQAARIAAVNMSAAARCTRRARTISRRGSTISISRAWASFDP